MLFELAAGLVSATESGPVVSPTSRPDGATTSLGRATNEMAATANQRDGRGERDLITAQNIVFKEETEQKKLVFFLSFFLLCASFVPPRQSEPVGRPVPCNV